MYLFIYLMKNHYICVITHKCYLYDPIHSHTLNTHTSLCHQVAMDVQRERAWLAKAAGADPPDHPRIAQAQAEWLEFHPFSILIKTAWECLKNNAWEKFRMVVFHCFDKHPSFLLMIFQPVATCGMGNAPGCITNVGHPIMGTSSSDPQNPIHRFYGNVA